MEIYPNHQCQLHHNNMKHLPLWYLGKIESNLCDTIVHELLPTESKGATMGVKGEETNTNTRNTIVRFADAGYWLGNVFSKFVSEANNECQWQYDIDGSECVQFAEYNEGHHYTWHTDTFTLSGKPVDRKITVVTLLNDDFFGGQFDIRLYGEYEVPLQKGSMVAFPSILEHRVRPIVSGKRYSATMWFNGPRFR
jgi:hypothetical protein